MRAVWWAVMVLALAGAAQAADTLTDRCTRPGDDHDRIIDACTPIINSSNPGKVNRSWAYNNRGSAYNGKNEHALAIADFTEAIRIRPDNALALFNRGNAYSRQGE